MFQTTLLAAAVLFTPATNNPQIAKSVARADTLPGKDHGEIVGYYSCNGKEGASKNYSGVAFITKKNEVYIVQWMIGTGAAFFGVGIRDGDTLAVSWAIPGDKGVVRGVNLYRIETGPRLVGRWTAFPGDGAIRTETLTFLKRFSEE